MVTRFTVWLLAIFLLAGCSTVRFISVKTPTARTTESAQPTWTSEYVPSVSEPVVKTLQYGRFTVKMSPDGSQVIEGGVFVPSLVMPVSSSKEHAIVINYTTKELSYYRRTSAGAYEPVVGYAVITPDQSVLLQNEVRGMVRRIDRSPSWCVTPQIRDALRKKGVSVEVKCYPHGHPQNAMGNTKFEIVWNVSGFAHVRLHETSGYALGNFWEDTTLGCTRLQNDAMEKLVELLGSNAVREGIEIIAFKGTKIPEKVTSKTEFIAD
jgi:hypothetical protein